MRERSLHLLGRLRLRSVARRALGRLFSGREREPAPDLALIPRAALAIREYAREHAALFERAQRLREKAERLERAGTPSESAANRAERARMEVEAGLIVLRDAFAVSLEERERAFDHEVGRLYPALGTPVR